ncbi:MAG TPA: hypothetical protein VK324_05615 [Tepidisphaeraceae bacterium]|nr:hypothetical protein [Tepidisphaeraceae bacterium]
MADLTVDTRPAEIVEDVRKTLADATVAGKKVFAAAAVYDDLATFQRVADPQLGVQAGVIARQPERGPAMDNSDDHTVRLSVDVALRFSSVRAAGADETKAVGEMLRLAGLVRQALSGDRGRGGRAHSIVWAGAVLDGTDFRGAPRIVPARPNQAYFTAVVPIACGWAVPRQ